MGLDIIVYRRLKETKDAVLDEAGYPVKSYKEWKPGNSLKMSEKIYPGRGKGLNPDKVYTYEDSYHFRAGSYASYLKWSN